jgi:hypothetical protein
MLAATGLACQSFPSFFLCLRSTWTLGALAYTTTVVGEVGEKTDDGGQTTTQTKQQQVELRTTSLSSNGSPSLFFFHPSQHPSRVRIHLIQQRGEVHSFVS